MQSYTSISNILGRFCLQTSQLYPPDIMKNITPSDTVIVSRNPRSLIHGPLLSNSRSSRAGSTGKRCVPQRILKGPGKPFAT